MPLGWLDELFSVESSVNCALGGVNVCSIVDKLGGFWPQSAKRGNCQGNEVQLPFPYAVRTCRPLVFLWLRPLSWPCGGSSIHKNVSGSLASVYLHFIRCSNSRCHNKGSQALDEYRMPGVTLITAEQMVSKRIHCIFAEWANKRHIQMPGWNRKRQVKPPAQKTEVNWGGCSNPKALE